MFISNYKIVKIYNRDGVYLKNLANNNILLTRLRYLDNFILEGNNIYNYDGIVGTLERNDIEFTTEPTIKLYHVAINIDQDMYHMFIPNVSKYAPDDEGVDKLGFDDKPINHICFSDDIEKCLNSVYIERHCLEELVLFRLYSINVPINDKNLINYYEIYNRYNVKDGLFCHEYWYMNNIYLKSDIYVINNLELDDFYCVDDYEADLFRENILPYTDVEEIYYDEIYKIDFFCTC